MNSTYINSTDMYMSVLARLSTEEKIDLIGKLLESMKRKKHSVKKKTESDVFACFSGDWSDFTPERHFNRDVDTW